MRSRVDTGDTSIEKMTVNEFSRVIEETRRLLNDDSEWRGRYAVYAERIGSNTPSIASARRIFREWSPLKVYLNITSALAARGSVRFELRYLGQTVAELRGNKDKGFRINTQRYDRTNSRDFECRIPLAGADWRGEDAAGFRRFFRDRKGPRAVSANKGNEEHRLESLLLTEFSRKISRGKPLLGIQPVTIAGVRFPMPTPISASNPARIRYSGTRGGGIDILARTGRGGRATHLCIMELKIEGGSRQSRTAMRQASAYATFIRELLRSDAGAAWWKLFGFGGREVPNQLELYAACVMPFDKRNETSFGRSELRIDSDSIRLHYVYFCPIDEGIRAKIQDTTLTIV